MASRAGSHWRSQQTPQVRMLHKRLHSTCTTSYYAVILYIIAGPVSSDSYQNAMLHSGACGTLR
jgi:hypothetical protein